MTAWILRLPGQPIWYVESVADTKDDHLARKRHVWASLVYKNIFIALFLLLSAKLARILET